MSDTSVEETYRDFTIRFEQKAGILYVRVVGPRDDLDVSTSFWERIHARATETGVDRLLVEEDFPNQLSTIELFEVAKGVTALFGYRIKIAHVDHRAADMELNRFAETVANNRGLQVRVFDERNVAERWLKG